MDVRRLTVKDWLYCRRIGCQLSYAAYLAFYVDKEENIKRVVSAYMRHFMSKR
jgi:hypothetical protein